MEASSRQMTWQVLQYIQQNQDEIQTNFNKSMMTLLMFKIINLHIVIYDLIEETLKTANRTEDPTITSELPCAVRKTLKT